ncbi:MAG: AAA family ATPase [bacterium]|nr:AAA family ATPase [bacterium]
MIKKVLIENFKSIKKLELELGRFNVLIGENGCGKTNILEAIAFGGAAAARKLDNEFLSPRGIRVTEPQFMRSAFESKTKKEENKILLEFSHSNSAVKRITLHHDDGIFSQWTNTTEGPFTEKEIESIQQREREEQNIVKEIARLANQRMEQQLYLAHFLVYSPENTSLRTFKNEGQILPLGIKGEGLFRLLKSFYLSGDEERIKELKDNLELIDWFEDFSFPKDSAPFEKTLQIKDRYLDAGLNYFDQRSTNEGFLFLLFYLSLFISKDTPPFFAIDNLEASFNPKLCAKLSETLVRIGKEKEKQVIVTTHNPSILDGINLHDDDQRLFVVKRSRDGDTFVKRITSKPDPKSKVKLSEAWTRGYIGGLPKNF